MKQLNWAIVGNGNIAGQMAQAFLDNDRQVYAAGGRNPERIRAFCEKYRIENVYEDIDVMLREPQIDVVYIATPHNSHAEYIMKALSYGKHVLCEKAITLNSGELDTAWALAREKGLVLAEAMTIYHMPLYQRLKEITDSGVLGHINLIQANFGSVKEYDMSNRFFNPGLAGGALLDIGVYAISLVRNFMGQKPEMVSSQVRYAPSGVDEGAGIILSNQEGQMGVISLSLHAKQPKRCVICGDGGYIEIEEYPRADRAVICYQRDGSREVIQEGQETCALYYEIADMEASIAKEADRSFLEYTRDVMEIMTRLRRDWNIWYPEEN